MSFKPRKKKWAYNPDADHYLTKIAEGWPVIMRGYDDFAQETPIIEFKLPTMRVYVYPAADHINTLTLRTRETARQQYQEAKAEGKFVLFVKDTEKEVLRSYTLPLVHIFRVSDFS